MAQHWHSFAILMAFYICYDIHAQTSVLPLSCIVPPRQPLLQKEVGAFYMFLYSVI